MVLSLFIFFIPLLNLIECDTFTKYQKLSMYQPGTEALLPGPYDTFYTLPYNGSYPDYTYSLIIQVKLSSSLS
jgi:hypothetical protein